MLIIININIYDLSTAINGYYGNADTIKFIVIQLLNALFIPSALALYNAFFNIIST